MGTSKNLPHGDLAVSFSAYCVVKPCNTYSITAAFRLVCEKIHIRNLARVPVFREPLYTLQKPQSQFYKK